jgi:hypothetical protein
VVPVNWSASSASTLLKCCSKNVTAPVSTAYATHETDAALAEEMLQNGTALEHRPHLVAGRNVTSAMACTGPHPVGWVVISRWPWGLLPNCKRVR